MRKSILTLIFILAIVFAISACTPKRYCYNEPIIVNGHHVDQIECVSMVYPGRG